MNHRRVTSLCHAGARFSFSRILHEEDEAPAMRKNKALPSFGKHGNARRFFVIVN